MNWEKLVGVYMLGYERNVASNIQVFNASPVKGVWACEIDSFHIMRTSK